MKKFLTVLLVIAVMFTFSFGTAMATDEVTLADAESAIWAQASADIAAFDTVVTSFLANYADNTVSVDFGGNTISFSKTAIEAIMATVKEDVAKTINGEAAAQKAIAAADSSITKSEVEGYKTAIHNAYASVYGSAALLDTYIEGHADYHDEILRAEYDEVKAKAEAELAKIVPDNYTDTVPTDATDASKYYINDTDQIYTDGVITTEGYYSFRAQVKAVIEKKQKDFDAMDYSAATANNTIAANIKTYNDSQATLLTGLKTLIGTTYGIPTAKEEGWDAEDLDGAKALAISRLETAAAQEKAAQKATLQNTIRTLERKDTLTTSEKTQLENAQKALAAVDGDFAAIIEVETYLVNAMTDKNDVNAKNWASTDFEAEDKTLAVAKVEKVDALEEEAADLLKVLGFDGAKMYDEAQVNDALETAIDTVYTAANGNAVAAVNLGATPKQDVVKAEKARVLDNANKLEFDKVLYPAVNVWETAATDTNYDDAKLEEVTAAIDAAKAAIRAAKTVEEVDAAFLDGYKAYDAVLTKADRNTAQTKTAYTDAVAAAEKEINAAFASKVALAGGTTEFAKTYTLDATDVTAMIGTAGNDKGLYAAYTAEEVKEKAAEIIATINTLKTNKEIAAEAAAIATDVVAVKLPVTLADKDTVLSLVDRVNDYKDYMEAAGLTYDGTAVREALLDTLLDNVAALEKDVIEKEAKAIKDGGVTLDEEAAVEALQTKVDAFNDAYGKTVGATANTAPVLDAAVAEVLGTDFVAKKVAKLENDIAKIDPSANPLDVAAIKAAREAYDALGEVAIGGEYYSKLLSLENLVGTDEEAAKALLADVTAKTSSAKVSKGIKVTVKADVSELEAAGYTVEYKFYRSTKKASGYTYKMTSKTGKYTNTSGKKGVKYYYKAKLVVKNAAGEVVAESPLKQSTYACRTWTK